MDLLSFTLAFGIQCDEKVRTFKFKGVFWGKKEEMSLVVSRESLILSGLQWLVFFPWRRVRWSPDGNIPTTTQTCTGRDTMGG